MSVRENLADGARRTAAPLAPAEPRGPEQQATVARPSRDFHITAASTTRPVSRLSGGNQQKVVLAKWLATEPRCSCSTSRRAASTSARRPRSTAARGGEASAASRILVSSSETSELQLLCDRILVMYRGRIVARLDRDEADEARIARFAMGSTA